MRSGGEVQLRFTLPRRTTDGQSLAGAVLHGALCRQEAPGGPCRPVNAAGVDEPLPVPEISPAADTILWTDKLPPELATGSPRPVSYRVTLWNAEGRSAGASDPVYAAAGTAPEPVQHLAAEGSRSGVLLRWTAVAQAGEVLLERTQIDPKPTIRTASASAAAAPATSGRRSRPVRTTKTAQVRETPDPGVVWMQVAAGGADPGQTIDGTVVAGVRYRYVAVRQVTARVGGRTLPLRSEPSDPAEITWRDVFPPRAPQELTALGYATGDDHPVYAVDLIWQPVNDPGVAGYVVTRQALNSSGQPEGAPQTLTAAPVKTTGFHDQSAVPATAYEYTVVAIDTKGNVSPAATARVSAQGR